MACGNNGEMKIMFNNGSNINAAQTRWLMAVIWRLMEIVIMAISWLAINDI